MMHSLYTYNVYTIRAFKMKFIYTCTCIPLRRVLTSVLQESQGLTTYAFFYVAISDDISTHADFQVDGYHGC